MEVVKELLENSAYIEHRDMVGAKPHGKCSAETEVAKPRVNVCLCVCVCSSQGGWTALTWAAYKGRVEVTKLLLEHGANPNTTGQVMHTQDR